MSDQQPKPSIYVKLMPLMYGLIGACAMLFLVTLFCGRPVVTQERECPPPPECQAAREPALDAAGIDGRLSRSDADHLGGDLSPAGGDLSPTGGDLSSTGGDAGQGRSANPGPSRHAPDPARTSAPHRPPSAEKRLKEAIVTCVGPKARSFRLAVRLHPDGKVRRVFVAQDPGVNADMSGCIQRQVEAMSLAPRRTAGGYAEWRVLQVDGVLSLKQIRPRPGNAWAGSRRE